MSRTALVSGAAVRALAVWAGAVVFGSIVGCGSASSATGAGARPQSTRALPDRITELCAGVSMGDRERPFFFHPLGIEGVREVLGERANAKFGREELRGVEITVRNAPGVTRHQVMRVLRCHAAWSEALGFDLTGNFEDPLAVGVPSVSLVVANEGVVIRIEGHDRAEGEEILRRASSLLETGTVASN
jgi:hypothetical protein